MNKSYPNYIPGSFVYAPYATIDNDFRVGLFMIIYDEAYDADNSRRNENCIAFKVTSQKKQESNHAYLFTRKEVRFLVKDSFVLCTKPYILHKKNIREVRGVITNKQLSDFYYGRFAQTLLTYGEQIQKRIKGELINGKVL